MSTMPGKQYYTVGVLLFQGADILDFAGPMEVLSHVSQNRNPDDPDRMFTIQTIAQTSSIRAASALTVRVDVLLQDALENISEYDILIVPGGPAVLGLHRRIFARCHGRLVGSDCDHSSSSH
jgi:putative intracellular protease/amidase